MGYLLNDPDGHQIPVGLSMRIGSDPANDIVVDGPGVSASHAIIGKFPDGLLIRDEESSAGTFINDERIEHVTALMSGDRIRIGETEFLVEYESVTAPFKKSTDANHKA